MILNEKYKRDDFVDFLKNQFLTDFSKDIRSVNTNGLSSITKAYSLGFSKELDLQIFEFEYTGSSKKRITLTKEALTLMRDSANFRALAVFHKAESEEWRFSLMTATSVRNDKGKVGLSYSNPKRYSFLLGTYAKINTPTKFLITRGKIIDFNDLKSRFSVEVVNKEFYKDISESFNKLVGGTLVVGKKKQTFDPQLKLPSISDHSQTSLEFAVRLIGRIIFCWFLREKRSPAGNSLMPKELVSLESAKNTPDYYHKILEPIFFEILNKPQKSRIEPFDNELFSQIPYLNGGLFSPQEDDFYKRYKTDLQSQYNNTLIIPDGWICSLFEILETYNFTIDENTSYDEELSIDPEMLGRIFENLLAEINPETGDSARKRTGSYYTPRMIVDYMVDQSLYLYLKNKTEIDDKKIKSLISYDLDDDIELVDDEKDKIIKSLSEVKILDPACGSGAFPIGMLQKIVFILQQVDPDAKKMYELEIKQVPSELKRFIQKEYENGSFDYLRKLRIIRDCIYGVDIQPIATEISRLRCFLTLVVEQKIDDKLENRGIQPLPNLDFKFVTANSLIGLPKIDTSQPSMFDDYQKIDDLKNIRDEYYNSTGIEREQLKTEFVTQQKRLVDQLIKEHGFMGIAKADLTQKLTDWEPFTHKPTSWFESEWMFGIKQNFDIITGNPPYVNSKKIEKIIRKTYWNLYKNILTGDMDLYQLFIAFGINNLNEGGVLSYVTTNSYFTNQSFKLLRDFLLKNTKIISIHDFPHRYFPFESVNTETSIIITTKQISGGEKQKIGVCICSKNKNKFDLNVNKNVIVPSLEKTNGFFLDLTELTTRIIRDHQGVSIDFYKYFELSNPSSLDRKERQPETSYKKYTKCVFSKKEIEDDKELFLICEPCITGDRILRYTIHGDPVYTNISWGKDGNQKKINQKTYDLMKRPKLIGQRITGQARLRIVFTFDESGLITMPSVNTITLKNNFLNKNNLLFSLLGVINSKLYNFLYKDIFRENNTNITSDVFSIIPIPEKILENNFQDEINNFISKNLILKKSELDTINVDIENKIDKLIYKLYDLSEDEIKIVEESVK